MYRRQVEYICKDLEKKMVFIIGLRQAGKTWLAMEAGKRFDNTTYLNYDLFDDRDTISKRHWADSTELLSLGEIHKMLDWKNYLKGLYDTKPDK